jgi:hypothetical protein
MTIDVSVVICAYSQGRWDALTAAVDSVRRQTVQPRELIVVIDHNNRLLAQARQALIGVCVTENRLERGLSGARNTGISLARGQILAFLDDDAYAAPDWLERLSAGYADARVIGVGGAITPRWATGRPAWFPDEFDWVVGCTYRGMPEQPAPVRNLIGANMSLRAKVFATVGGFRGGLGRVETLPAGCEETELCIRAGQQWPDAILLFDPAAGVSHAVPPERSNWAYFCARCFAEGRSKALVTRWVGAAAGLASERAYVRRTLPRAAARGLWETLTRRDRAGPGRVVALGVGVLITTAGYALGRLSRSTGHSAAPTAEPGAGVA